MTYRPNPFGRETGAMQVAQALGEEITGRVVLITGISPTSIGASLALALSSQQPHLLILASRTASKIASVVKDILVLYPHTPIQQVLIDLSNPHSIRTAAAQIKTILATEKRELDILFNNAGINISERRLTNEGVELQFATNYLGPWLLTNLLLPLMLPSSTSTHLSDLDQVKSRKRIIHTSSEAHRVSPIRFSDINLVPGTEPLEGEAPRRNLPQGILRNDGRYEPSIAYAQSKTAQILHAVALNQRFSGKGVKSLAVMPGTIMTEILRDLDEDGRRGLLEIVEFWKSAEQGAAGLVVAGFGVGFDDAKIIYINDCQPQRPSRWATDPETAERLWKRSEEMVGERFVFGMERDGEGGSKL